MNGNRTIFFKLFILIVSSISGETKTEAKEVCLLEFESKGDILTNLCTPDSDDKKPYIVSKCYDQDCIEIDLETALKKDNIYNHE